MRLTPHFDSSEFDCHDGTRCPEHSYPDLRALCRNFLEPLRHVHGPVSIVSGYRTRRYNIMVGGAPASYHVYTAGRWGAAADVRCARGKAADWYATMSRLDPGGLGRYTDHVHVDNRPYHARW